MNAMMKAMGGKPEDLNFSAPLDNGQMGPINEVLRTPDERFAGLPDFPFAPNYFESRSHGRIRIHYLDEGSKEAKETVLLMHGEPTWCYLYRFMIPHFVQAGYRVIAPDLVGFGKSDKPAKRTDYSYERHVDWIGELIVGLDLDNITPFFQDWGGLIGLRVVARYPERFLRIVVSNTGLPTGGGANDSFRVWAGVVSQKMPQWGMLVSQGCSRDLSDAERAAYDAPFPSEEYKACSREFPRMVPQFEDHGSVEENKGAWRRVFQRWQKPLLTLFASNDPVTKGGEKIWMQKVPGAKGHPHEIIEGAGHFLQEDKPQELATKMIRWMKANPVTLNHPLVFAKL
eukprot:TRINITY_DN26439_c0_g1_i1.p1 TRINITY_DN26439_c0_g1~~TRINITY_DN26439_c0_g1_i1.p1  ORF type:complete len:368 (-),score=33.43 TRINITY_DN26439_c0_g1_i1:7-1032(-)